MSNVSSFFGKVSNWFNPEPDQAAGMFHYPRVDGDDKIRVHLRIDPDGQGLLILNANQVIHLNPSAAQMAHYYLEGFTPEKVQRKFKRQFKINSAQAKADYLDFCFQLEQLLENDACPVCELGLETTAPFSARPSAPYRMDLAITYRCNNNCSHCYNARSRHYPELSTADWKRVIERVWELRIPHLVFTGGEPTLNPDLAELVAHAENQGLITGLNTNGRKLADPAYVNALVSAGLDHVQITLESHDPAIHDDMVAHRDAWQETVNGIQNVLKTGLYIMTNTTLLTHNSQYLEETLRFLGELGVPTVGINALIYSGRGADVGTGLQEQSLPPLLEMAREITQSQGQRLIWYTPTQYCHFNPLQLGLGIKGCTAALYNMCIEPNGDVIPCQSYYESLGNFLEKPWQEIWEHPLALQLRNRTDIPEGCKHCEFLPECGGGCPLARDHQVIQPIVNQIFIT